MFQINNMKKNKKFYSIILIVIFIGIGFTGVYFIQKGPLKPQEIPLGDYSYVKSYSDFQIKKIMRENHVPGVAISLLDDEKIIMEEYYGVADLENSIELSNRSTFKIGSISKVFTAIEAMRLVEDGLVDLDRPISDYLPNFNISYHFDSQPITLRHILSHRSGLPRNDNLVQWHWDTQEDCLKSQMESLNGTFVAFPAGYRFKYSNVAFNIVGHLIEKLRGIPYVYYMANNLFKPIGMEHTQFVSGLISDPDTIVPGYYRSGRKNVLYNDYDIIDLASGGALSTIGDMQTFIKFLANEGTLNGESIINQSTLLSMYKTQFFSPEDPQKVGLGFSVNSDILRKKVVFHAGTNLGRKSMVAFIPETKQGIILIGNHEDFEEPSKELVFDILELMIETKTGQKPLQDEKYTEFSMNPTTLGQFVGDYNLEGDIVTVQEKRGKLKVNYGGFGFTLKPIKERTFAVTSLLSPYENLTISFIQGNRYYGESDQIMIVSIDGVHHIYCPRINTFSNEIDGPDWENFPSLTGKYNLRPRIHSIYTESDDFGTAMIENVDGYIILPMYRAVLFPISSTEILLLGGEWGGETLFFDPNTGVLTFQHLTFHPTD